MVLYFYPNTRNRELEAHGERGRMTLVTITTTRYLWNPWGGRPCESIYTLGTSLPGLLAGFGKDHFYDAFAPNPNVAVLFRKFGRHDINVADVYVAVQITQAEPHQRNVMRSHEVLAKMVTDHLHREGLRASVRVELIWVTGLTSARKS